MKRLWLVLAASCTVALGVAAAPAQAQVADRSAVTPWIELELDAIASHRTNPPRASRALAHVSVAMYLAALAGGQGRDDAVAGAASTVLAAFFPNKADELEAMAEEAAVSRLYGGIHFRSDNEAGLDLSRRVGTVALEAYRVARAG